MEKTRRRAPAISAPEARGRNPDQDVRSLALGQCSQLRHGDDDGDREQSSVQDEGQTLSKTNPREEMSEYKMLEHC